LTVQVKHYALKL